MRNKKIAVWQPKKIIDLVVISALPLLILFTVTPATTPPLFVIFLWFIAPSLYLIYRSRKNLYKISLGSLAIGLAFMAGDILVSCSGAWTTAGRIFPFGVRCISLEEQLWVLFLTFYTIVFYEHFCDDENIFSISKSWKRLMSASIIFYSSALVFVLFSTRIHHVSYAYLKGGIIGVVSIILYIALKRPSLFKKFLPVTVYFFCYELVMEVQAVKEGWWLFPDVKNYIGTIALFGATFPVEELIFWMILSTSFLLAYYELYVDDAL